MASNNNGDSNKGREIRYRTNDQIRGVYECRLIGVDGKMVGILPFRDARKMAEDCNLDLVEINRGGNPAICKIMDYGKFRFDSDKAAKEARKKQNVRLTKELCLRPATDVHDLVTKAKNIRKWLDDGDRVEIVVKMKGREKAHPEQCVQKIRELLEYVGSYKMESQPTLVGGKNAVALISP